MSRKLELPQFLEAFSPVSLQHRKPESYWEPWVFWSENEGSQNSSSSADLIKSALSNLNTHLYRRIFIQFWAPVTIGGRRLLSTSGQPFVVDVLYNDYAEYRLDSMKYKYDIDVNKLHNEHDPMIKSGGPATAFLNCRTHTSKLQKFLSVSSDKKKNFSVMLPICFPFQSNSCIGVLEFTFDDYRCDLGYILLKMVRNVKEVGLDVFYVQDLIPYKTINGLEATKDEIEVALKVVCETHNLALAQVWIGYEDKNNVAFTYSVVDTQTKPSLAIKLNGYLYAEAEEAYYNHIRPYFILGDVYPRPIQKELADLVALQDYQSRYISVLRSNILNDWRGGDFLTTSALAICLRSNDTNDFSYVFEFIWTKHPNHVILLEAIILTIKRCLPRFKFASGAELGDELNVIDVETSTDDRTKRFKIFEGKGSSPMPNTMEEVKKATVRDNIASSKVTCKTSEKVLPREVIERQFGKTMKDAAKNLDVSESTLKRKLRKLGILEWPGPNLVKKKAKNSSIIQIDVNEEDNGVIQEPSTINVNENSLTIKAELEDDMIKFRLPILQATFETVEKEIGRKFNLSLRTFKLRYRDEVGDWILLKSDEDMSYCIESSRKVEPNEVRLRVELSTQPISGPSGSNGICSNK